MIRVPPNVFRDAVAHFWRTRNAQAQRQGRGGRPDRGQRRHVTGGRHMDGFGRAIKKFLVKHGVPEQYVCIGASSPELPGFYRPSKQWDLVVATRERLFAAVELKAHVGPSFGNNFNNRVEELLGSALDVWEAYEKGLLPSQPVPWLGLLLLIEDCASSRRSVKAHGGLFPGDAEFTNASYAKRYEIFCRRLLRQRQYNGACLLLSPRPTGQPKAEYSEPAEDLSARRFLTGLAEHVLGHLRALEQENR